MPAYQLDQFLPDIDPSCWIAPCATIIGNVVVGSGSSIWFGSAGYARVRSWPEASVRCDAAIRPESEDKRKCPEALETARLTPSRYWSSRAKARSSGERDKIVLAHSLQHQKHG